MAIEYVYITDETALLEALDRIPEPFNVANAPASPGQYVAVPAASVSTSVQITAANLVPGVRYRMRLSPDVITNAVRGVWKCAAGAAPITSLADGTPILGHEEVTILLPAGSTKVRLFFWLSADTAFDCHVWLSRADS